MRKPHVRAHWAAFIAAGLVGLVGCELGLPAGSEPHRETNFLDMGDQPKLKPQRTSLTGVGLMGMREPPAGSVAIDEFPYGYTQKEGDLAGAALKNPLQGSPQVVARGKFVYDNVCITCHGPKGAGDGHLTKLFPKPPSLMTQKIRDWPDGRIFHVPTRGQASMPAHTSVVEPMDVWAVIHYVRELQKTEAVAPAAKTDNGAAQGATGGAEGGAGDGADSGDAGAVDGAGDGAADGGTQGAVEGSGNGAGGAAGKGAVDGAVDGGAK